MVAYNTNYYRRNKEKRFKVHKCPHCTFETTGPKSSLQAHIWAKHTEEKDRPFQCPCETCNRGYSARANLHKHMKQCHNVIIPKDKGVIAYVINVSQYIRNPEKTQEERIEYYKKNMLVESKNINTNITSKEKMYYDKKCGIIDLRSYTKKDILDLK